MVTTQLGTLPSSPVFKNGFLGSGSTDVFVMDAPGSSAHINLNLRSEAEGRSKNTTLRLFEDTNRNGKFDQFGNQRDKLITFRNGAGTDILMHARTTGADRYFATVSNSDSKIFGYEMRATNSKPSQIFQPNPASFDTLSFGTESGAVFDTDASETYAFFLNSSTAATMSISQLTGDADMRLIRDFNGNGVVDTNEEVARSARGGTQVDFITGVTGAGKYLLQVYQFSPGRIDYNLNFNTFNTNAAGPANSRATEEVQVGNISRDLTRKGAVNNRDPGDSFAFSLSEGQTLGLKLKELSGDSYLRVVQDRNSDGTIQKNEVLQTSIGVGNLEKISSLSGAGDYIAQVWQVGDGNARYKLTFDNAPSSAPARLKI